jgi:plasmid maintenance system antidote protein VapI
MSINATHPSGAFDRGWFRVLLMRILAEGNMTQYWLATRAHLAKTTLNKLVNGRRSPTEAQALQTGAGVVCTDAELGCMRDLLDARRNETAGPALAALMASTTTTVVDLARATGIGERIVAAFVAGTLNPTEAEVLRLFVAAVVRDARLALINRLLEAARYHTIRGLAGDGAG